MNLRESYKYLLIIWANSGTPLTNKDNKLTTIYLCWVCFTNWMIIFLKDNSLTRYGIYSSLNSYIIGITDVRCLR